MKKLLAVAVVAMFSANCMAGSHSRAISVTNKTGNEVEVKDSGRKGNENNATITIKPGRTMRLNITVHEPKGSWFPSSLMPHVTTITVTDDEGSNSIQVDEHTKKVIINEGLELSKVPGESRNESSDK
jgi:hypothetical protein